jgi:hypothetical protein
MFRVAYCNFGTYESLVLNHTVGAGNLAGVRWYEIRNPSSDVKLFQQGTIFDPNVNYWLGSIAQDKAGNIALGFSAASKSVYPSVYFAGRAATDPAGTLSGPTTMVGGTGAQVNSYHRWGDYSSMTIDPTDDCTLWYTQEYYSTTSSFNWQTRIGSFRFSNCKNGK